MKVLLDGLSVKVEARSNMPHGHDSFPKVVSDKATLGFLHLSIPAAAKRLAALW